MKKIMKQFLTLGLSTVVLATGLHSLDAAFVDATPTTEITVSGTYTNVYLHGTVSVKMGEGLFPLTINAILEPDGAKTKLTIACGEGEPRYIAGTPGTDRPKSFPAFLESGQNALLQLEDAALPVDKKKTLHIITAHQGMPVVFKLMLGNLTKPVAAAGAPSLTLTGNGHERFAISQIIPKGGALIAKSLTGQESPLPFLDFFHVTKGDLIELLRQIASRLPATLAAFSIDSKTTPTGTETTFSVNVKI
ncbi:hypothetical protein [Candidatus Bodocaedibacter vickermanii]|uniref:Uncharacterized protein n=1 Tax=Candidatus Bodocaedibacter vickermanii TaxID=2741701 RepID=A0A7L9RSQ1_9PROT|nr:hypothetical protein CPBP_00401 [Candidatus Paracaedibacteraceae bacterium 'Lake Konstanz']